MEAAIGSVITIDNFTSKMPPFDPNGTENHLYGLVDMGSNGIRFSISDLSPPRSRLLQCIYRERAGISLYDALHEETPDAKPFHFSKQTITQVADTLARFRSICDSYRVHKGHISVFATEAMRTAENRDEMLLAIKQASGLIVDVLSPAMESLFGAMGARSAFKEVNGLFMDLGGGSVQLTYMNSNFGEGYDKLAADAATSLPFGAAKLTASLSNQITAEIAKGELQTCMKDTFELLKTRFPQLKEQEEGEGVSIFFCGGGFRGYGNVLMHTDPIQPYPIPAIGGYVAPGDRFTDWPAMVYANTHEKVHGISKRRREQFPAIAIVIESIVEAIPKIREVTFCSGGNREGVLYMKLQPDVREENPLYFIPGSPNQSSEVIASIVTCITSALPEGYPKKLSPDLLQYVAKNTWQDMGDPDDANSARALHKPISGYLLPGMLHKTRAILALIMCARWGVVLGRVDKKLHENLQALLGANWSWWCEYLGAVASCLAIVSPAFPSDEDVLGKTIKFTTSSGHALGKKKNKLGLRLGIWLSENARRGVRADSLEGMFNSVGKGLDFDRVVEAKLAD